MRKRLTSILMKSLSALLLVLITTGTALAQIGSEPKRPIFTSVYTDMKRDCKTLAEPKGEQAGGDPAGACKGYGGHRIFISYSAWAASFSVERLKDSNESIDLATDYYGYGEKGEKVEWRLADGKPFAVIMRIGKYKDGENPFQAKNRTGSKLIIKGLKGYEKIDFEVDGATANANWKARDLADQGY